ncbi:MAG: 4-(cytidine 5'-diphospho)-2-C-methyl-D-erythritol kinase [Deltaproteobacteria bacterium]
MRASSELRGSGGRLEGVARPHRIAILAHAKVNLTLELLGRREDGYHDIRSWMVPLALADRLTVERASRGLTLEVPGHPELSNDDNLVARACRAFQARFGRPRGLRLRLEKRIPIAAGLGGGSSDAAATLRALALLEGLRAPAALRELALALGSDVPFFLGRGPALATGRGERLHPAPPCPRLWLLVAKPPFGISAAEAYAAARPRGRRRSQPRLTAISTDANWSMKEWGRLQSVRSGRGIGGLLVNDLQAGAVRNHPELGRLLRTLRALSPHGALMSGSGSCCFGLFSSASSAREAARRLGQIALEQTIVTRPVSAFSPGRRLD